METLPPGAPTHRRCLHLAGMGRKNPTVPHAARRSAKGQTAHRRRAGRQQDGHRDRGARRGCDGCFWGRLGGPTSAPPHRRRSAMTSPNTPPGEVNRVQRWFQAVVTHPDGVEAGADSDEAQRLIHLPPGQLEKVITRSRALSAAERLAIYANAYHTRLLECLAEVYPMLKRTVGEEAFDGFAFGYLQEFPSRSYTLNELGRHFPHYLQETRPTTDNGESESASADSADNQPALAEDWPDFLIDLAQLEWAIYDVFDGVGVEGQPLLRAGQLSGIPPQSWPQFQLQPV